HVDHGKTSLSDSLIASNGLISDKLAGKIRFLDDTKEEQLRGITMKSSVISLIYEATKGANRESYLINLVDSPGHVDFSFDVSTAVRICDGALVLIDAVEGVCPQTHAVLHQAWIEGIRPCLVINKIDRLILELGLDPFEAYQRMERIIEQGNAILSSLIRSDVIARYDADQGSISSHEKVANDHLEGTILDEIAALEEQLLFSPLRGNVLFSSAIDGWAFGIGYFAHFYAQKLTFDTAGKTAINPIQILRQTLWGDYYYNPGTRRVTTKSPNQNCLPMFVQYILKPIWKAYKIISAPITSEQSVKKVRDLATQMGVLQNVNDRDLRNTDRRIVMKSLMSKWLPLSQSVLKMVTRVLPSPALAQRARFHKLCTSYYDEKFTLTRIPNHVKDLATEVADGIKSCNAAEEAPLVIYVCKMICVDARLLSNYKQLCDEKHISLSSIRNESLGNTAEPRQEFDEQPVYIAIGRIFSGILRQGQELYIMGPKYNGCRESVSASSVKSIPHVATVEVDKIVPYLVMGRELYHVTKVPAGNIVGILGLQDFILKTATLSTTLLCPRFTKMPFQTKPIVRVAVEPEDPRDFEKLECGLQRLYRSDPTVEVQIQESGEHVIVALGELHLDRCIKDLKERFAKVSVRVSEPLVPFRETVVDGEISSFQESVVFRELADSTIQESKPDNFCNAAEEAPLIIYVCKMICVDARLLSNYKQLCDEKHISLSSIRNESLGNTAEPRQEFDEQPVYIAIGRIFSGILRQGQELYIMGPKYNGCRESVSASSVKSIPHVATVEVDKIVPYLVMGRELYHVTKVPAGNIVGILGLQDFILKTATLSTTLLCPRFTKMPFQTKPIVRVAVEPEDPRDFEKLECGLQRLYRSDPTVEVQIQESGEHVIVALGELHLDRCIKDLKERFAKVSVRVSEPLVPFRETVVDGEISSFQESVVFRELADSTIQESKPDNLSTDCINEEQIPLQEQSDTSKDVATGTICNGSVKLSIRVLPLPSKAAQFLEDNANTLKQMATSDEVVDDGTQQVPGVASTDYDIRDGSARNKSVLRTHLAEDLRKVLDESDTNKTFWRSLEMSRIWSFGPHHCGSNLLINNVSWYINKRFALGGCAIESPGKISKGAQDKLRQQILEKLENSIITGFQLATIAGPLCEEQVWGAAFIIEDICISEKFTSEQYEATSSSNFGPLSGQIISTMKSTCRLAFIKKPVRLVEAIYTCSVQCQAEQLGKLYSVLSKRRANVICEDLADKMSLFTIKAHLPVVESFGLATDIRTQTSGAASNPQLVFSHWTMLETDPFFQPQTEEEREDLGERTYEMNYVRKYIEAIRKRKGLIRDEKVVVHAEKQRTLGRKK
ncbi:hypothetical protein ABG067_007508, partial [Albugo candida]